MKKLVKKITRSKQAAAQVTPVIIPRAEHNISRTKISPSALKVLYRLTNSGYAAFLVGGCVRDLLLGFQPKDFDVATNASPEEVRALFKNSRIIGRRFRLVHVVFGPEMIEVATFRTHHENSNASHGLKSQTGMLLRDNVYGTIEDDAWRRDFTINALYYNIADFSVIDYTGGMQDIQSRKLRIIGDPLQRYHEDPVRLLRAIRFMAKLKLDCIDETAAPILQLSHLLDNVSPARLFQEVLKFFQEGALLPTIQLLQKYQLFLPLFPLNTKIIEAPLSKNLLYTALQNADQRIKEGKSVSPAFLFAVFLWQPIADKVAVYKKNDKTPFNITLEKAIQFVLHAQSRTLAMPRVLMIAIREICILQYRFTQRAGKRPYHLLEHPRYRAAYDLLLLRTQIEEVSDELSLWWRKFQAGDETIRENMLAKIAHKPRRKQRMRPKQPAIHND